MELVLCAEYLNVKIVFMTLCKPPILDQYLVNWTWMGGECIQWSAVVHTLLV